MGEGMIDLYVGGEVVAQTKVDADVYEAVSGKRWLLSPNGYAYRVSTDGAIYLHRVVLGLERGDKACSDHINRDRLDNRRENLRAVSQAQNMQNLSARRGLSAHRGVTYSTRDDLWRGRVQLAGRLWTRYFKTEDEAAQWAAEKRREVMPFSEEAAA